MKTRNTADPALREIAQRMRAESGKWPTTAELRKAASCATTRALEVLRNLREEERLAPPATAESLPIPEQVGGLFQGVWNAASQAAARDFEGARAEFNTRLAEARGEAAELLEAVGELEAAGEKDHGTIGDLERRLADISAERDAARAGEATARAELAASSSAFEKALAALGDELRALREGSARTPGSEHPGTDAPLS